MDEERRYWAFISYSHKDRAWARWLHRALESYAIPKRLVGREGPDGPVPTRLRPVFKDRDDLAANASLRGRVNDALAASSALVVICSPNAARSEWVEDEIVRFKAMHGEARVFPLIVAGTPNAARLPGREDDECFPVAIRFQVDGDGALTDHRAEPIGADVRPSGDGRRLARLKLVAGILGLDLDDLIQRDAKRRGRQLAAVAAASMVGTAAMGALSVAALVSRNEAQEQRTQAEGLVEFMLGDLSDKLNTTGRLDLLDAVAKKLENFYARQAAHGLDAEALGQRARMLHLLGELSRRRGDLADAAISFDEAAVTTAELLARAPKDTKWIFNHAQSVYYVGALAEDRGDYARARSRYLEYLYLAGRLVAREPHRDGWLREVEYANAALGALALKVGHVREAIGAFSHAFDISSSIVAKNPNDRDREMDLAQCYAWLADSERRAGALGVAMHERRLEGLIYRGMLARQPGDDNIAESQVINATAIAKIMLKEGQERQALVEITPAVTDIRRLCALSPDDAGCEQQEVLALDTEAEAYLDSRALAAASKAAAEARTVAEILARKEATEVYWQGVILGGARILQIRIALEATNNQATRRNLRAQAILETKRIESIATTSPASFALVDLTQEAKRLNDSFGGIK